MARHDHDLLNDRLKQHQKSGGGGSTRGGALGRGSSGRSVPLAYAAVSIALVVAVIAVAYGTQAPSLGVAEFAPAARQQLESPPTSAGSRADPGRGRTAGSRATTTTTSVVGETSASEASSTPTTRVARSRGCIGNPPRQIADPQSPPCVAAIFEGDNGGSTTRGVTATEVGVAVPTGSATTDAAVQILFDYFNSRFEFYGRRLVPHLLPYGLYTAVEQRATAANIVALNPFAALDARDPQLVPTATMVATLAQQHVIAITGRTAPYSDALLYDERHPYVWGVYQSIDQVWQQSAELVCKSLAGNVAAHAGGALAKQTRKFGLVVEAEWQTGQPQPMNDRYLQQQLAECGVEPVTVNIKSLYVAADRTLIVNRLKEAGVTTIMCACSAGVRQLVQGTSAVSDYEPELLLPEIGAHIEASERDFQDPVYAQWTRHAFGIFPQPKVLPYQARSFFTAIREVDPTFALTTYDFVALEGIYRQLLVLAAGVQGAGPNLTPESFAAGLMTMQFPNPGAGQAPFWQPSVGFGPGDHTMNNGVALAWWNPTIDPTSLVTSAGRKGAFCFLGAGVRFGPGEIPTDADSRFFNPAEACR